MSAGVISSRTPEGRSARCPLCGASVCIEPSYPAADAPCPSCGHLLFFVSDRPARRRKRTNALPSRLGRLVRDVAGRVVRTVRGVLPRRAAAQSPAPANSQASGVWDPWLDG